MSDFAIFVQKVLIPETVRDRAKRTKIWDHQGYKCQIKNILLYIAELCIVESCIAEFCIAEFCIVEFCIAEFCIAEFCIAEFCIAEFCIAELGTKTG